MADEELDDLAYIAAENARERGMAPALDVVPGPEPVIDAPPEPAKAAAVVEEPAGDTPPEPEPSETFERWEDPDTGEKLDMRTRRAKRIKHLWQERQDYKRELDALRAQLTNRTPTQPAAAAGPTDPTSPRPTTPGASPKPKLEQFESVEDWEEAVATWRDTQRSQHAAQQQHAQQIKTTWESHLARETAARTKYPDYDTVVGKPLPFNVPDALKVRIASSAQSADLMYHLAQHPEELRTLTAGSEIDAAYALGRLEASLTIAAQPKPAATTAAPTPGRPLKTTAPTADIDVFAIPDDLEYIARQNARDRARRLAGVEM
jgi:hypothetical protein